MQLIQRGHLHRMLLVHKSFFNVHLVHRNGNENATVLQAIVMKTLPLLSHGCCWPMLCVATTSVISLASLRTLVRPFTYDRPLLATFATSSHTYIAFPRMPNHFSTPTGRHYDQSLVCHPFRSKWNRGGRATTSRWRFHIFPQRRHTLNTYQTPDFPPESTPCRQKTETTPPIITRIH